MFLGSMCETFYTCEGHVCVLLRDHVYIQCCHCECFFEEVLICGPGHAPLNQGISLSYLVVTYLHK